MKTYIVKQGNTVMLKATDLGSCLDFCRKQYLYDDWALNENYANKTNLDFCATGENGVIEEIVFQIIPQ